MDIDEEFRPVRTHRNWSELYASSQALLHQQSSQTPRGGGSSEAARLGAQELLGSSYYYQPPFEPTTPGGPSNGRFEAPTSTTGGGTTTTTTTGGAAAPPPPPVWERLEDRLARRQNEILMDMMQRTEAITQSTLDELVETQLQRAWERDRKIWMQELIGTRTLGGAAAAAATTTNDAMSELGRIADLRSGAILSSLASPTRLALPLSSLAPMATTSNLDASMVRSHLEIVRDKLTPTSNVKSAIHAFLDVPLPSNQPSSNDAGYRTSWHLLLQLIEAPAGQLHPLSASNQARAALACWTLQFQSHVHERIRQARQSPPPKLYQNELAQACAQFVTLTLGVTPANDGSAAWWPIVYYCLRCGDALAAQEVVQQGLQPGSPTTVHDAVLRLLEAYATAQDNAPTVWLSGSVPRLNPNDVSTVQDLMAAVLSSEEALFQAGCFALLSCTNLPSDDTTIGFCNIEDYLTSHLWQAVLSTTPHDELVKLGNSIQDFGPSYFGTHEAWSYSLPLLATQQYASALEHLRNAGGPNGLLQAAHLALVLTCMGIAVQDLGTPNDATSVSSSSSLVASLLVDYAHAILPVDGAMSALEYVVRIPTKARATKEVARLIATTGQLDELVGTLNEEGMREGGPTSLHTFGLDLPVVLGEAAGMMLRDSAVAREKIGAAAKCYMLSERYGDVLQLLSHRISPPEQSDPDRDFWIQQTKSFHEHYLAKRTHVVDVLERTAPNAIATSRTLLGLNRYFALIEGGQINEAWELLGHLNLLPQSKSDLTTKETAYRGLDALVQAAMAAVLVTTMESMYREHQTLQHQMGGAVARNRLEQVKAQAKALVAFAGMIGVAGNQMQTVSRLESLMS